LVVDAEFEIVAGTGLDEIVDEIFLVLFRQASRRLLAQQGAVFGGHELAPGGKPLGLRYRKQLRLVALALDLADYRKRHAVSPQPTADGHESQQSHEEIAHAAGGTADIRHLREDNLKLVHDLRPDLIRIGEASTLAQHRFGKIKALAHGGFH